LKRAADIGNKVLKEEVWVGFGNDEDDINYGFFQTPVGRSCTFSD
jgi:hypothetical protein